MDRVVAIVRFEPGIAPQVRQLLASGPLFDPRTLGIERHYVAVDDGLAVLVFEGESLDESLHGLVDDPAGTGVLAAWLPLLTEAPRLAREAYTWNVEEDTMKTILIATDGSPAAGEAVRTGLELAVEQNAEVVFTHVVPPVGPGPLGLGVPALVQRSVEPSDELPLAEAERVAAAVGVPARSQLLQGDVVDEIVALGDSLDVDLIVVGSRGHGGLASTLLGSVSRGVMRETRRPVVVVRTPHDAQVPVLA
jgi:nucleotide-binding universal stress UspA family protein